MLLKILRFVEKLMKILRFKPKSEPSLTKVKAIEEKMTLHHPRVAIEIGRICLKTAGKEAGRKCVIVDIIDEYKRSKNFVLVTGPKSISGVKRRRANIKHLIPTDRKVNISKGATDEEVYKALESEGLLDFMRRTKRSTRPQ